MNKQIKQALLSVFFISFFCSQTAFGKTYSFGIAEFWMPYGAAFVAQEKGFWKAEGVDVEVRMFTGYDGVPAFKHGKLDFYNIITSSAIELINEYPENIFIYEYDWSNGGDKFLLSNSIKDINELKGKIIGMYSDDISLRFFLSKILKKQSSLTLSDVKMRQAKDTPSLSKAFKRGVFSAVIQFDPEATKLVNEGAGRPIANSAEYPGVIGDGFITQKKLLKENPEDVKKVLRGWLSAVQWLSEPKNKNEYYEILNRTLYKTSPLSKKELLENETGAIVPHAKEEILMKNGERLTTFTQEVMDYLKTTGVKLHSEDPKDYVDTSLAREVVKEFYK
ncbi:MAG: ABC transporter substrate-binding protein [Nitrospinae bacterium]|nr:ABC transporter substrate-binding protein [Nitrospinota bacterium]